MTLFYTIIGTNAQKFDLKAASNFGSIDGTNALLHDHFLLLPHKLNVISTISL